MNVDDSGFDSDTKAGSDRITNKMTTADSEGTRLHAHDDELGVEGEHGAEDHLLSLPETAVNIY